MTAPPRLPASMVVGRILRPHGVRGEVLVEVVSDVAERFAPGATVELVDAKRVRREVEVLASRAHRGQLLVRFDGIGDRDAAEVIRGASLEVAGERVPEPPSGWFYHHQLIGLRCTDSNVGPLGTVDEVIEDGGGLLLSLRLDEQTLLVPFVKDYVRRVDLERETIELELPQGLVDLCASRS